MDEQRFRDLLRRILHGGALLTTEEQAAFDEEAARRLTESLARLAELEGR